MGLDISVGAPARWKRELEPEEFAEFIEGFVSLNEVLVGAGLPPHEEPFDLADEDGFEAQMYSYAGLHTVRRLAAYWALKGRLPTAGERAGDAAEDPVLAALFQAQVRHHDRPRSTGLIARFISRPSAKPKFQHLLWHSDCEGFYVPQSFADVILDPAQPQRPALGGMVGSSVALLEECRELASLIELPADIDPVDEALWEAADSPSDGGARWTSFGVEAFCLSRLIKACELSIRHGAVVLFT